MLEIKHYNGKDMGGAKKIETTVSRWNDEPISLGFMFWGKPKYKWVFLTFFRSLQKMFYSVQVHPYYINVWDSLVYIFMLEDKH